MLRLGNDAKRFYWKAIAIEDNCIHTECAKKIQSPILIYLFIQQCDLFEYLKSWTKMSADAPWRQRVSFSPFLLFVVCLCVCVCVCVCVCARARVRVCVSFYTFFLWYSCKMLVISNALLHRFLLPLYFSSLRKIRFFIFVYCRYDGNW